MPKLHYCCRNLKSCARPVYDALKVQYPEFKHKKKDCLGKCGKCTKHVMVRVGKNELLCCKDPEELYQDLKRLLG